MDRNLNTKLCLLHSMIDSRLVFNDVADILLAAKLPHPLEISSSLTSRILTTLENITSLICKEIFSLMDVFVKSAGFQQICGQPRAPSYLYVRDYRTGNGDHVVRLKLLFDLLTIFDEVAVRKIESSSLTTLCQFHLLLVNDFEETPGISGVIASLEKFLQLDTSAVLSDVLAGDAFKRVSFDDERMVILGIEGYEDAIDRIIEVISSSEENFGQLKFLEDNASFINAPHHFDSFLQCMPIIEKTLDLRVKGSYMKILRTILFNYDSHHRDLCLAKYYSEHGAASIAAHYPAFQTELTRCINSITSMEDMSELDITMTSNELVWLGFVNPKPVLWQIFKLVLDCPTTLPVMARLIKDLKPMCSCSVEGVSLLALGIKRVVDQHGILLAQIKAEEIFFQFFQELLSAGVMKGAEALNVLCQPCMTHKDSLDLWAIGLKLIGIILSSAGDSLKWICIQTDPSEPSAKLNSYPTLLRLVLSMCCRASDRDWLLQDVAKCHRIQASCLEVLGLLAGSLKSSPKMTITEKCETWLFSALGDPFQTLWALKVHFQKLFHGNLEKTPSFRAPNCLVSVQPEDARQLWTAIDCPSTPDHKRFNCVMESLIECCAVSRELVDELRPISREVFPETELTKANFSILASSILAPKLPYLSLGTWRIIADLYQHLCEILDYTPDVEFHAPLTAAAIKGALCAAPFTMFHDLLMIVFEKTDVFSSSTSNSDIPPKLVTQAVKNYCILTKETAETFCKLPTSPALAKAVLLEAVFHCTTDLVRASSRSTDQAPLARLVQELIELAVHCRQSGDAIRAELFMAAVEGVPNWDVESKQQIDAQLALWKSASAVTMTGGGDG